MLYIVWMFDRPVKKTYNRGGQTPNHGSKQAENYEKQQNIIHQNQAVMTS